MSIASEITNYANGLSDAYDAVNDMQGVIPQDKNMNNLDTAIRTIPQSQGSTYTAGNGINIDANNEISIDDTVVAELSDIPTVVQTLGSSTTDVMSQKAVTDTIYGEYGQGIVIDAGPGWDDTIGSVALGKSVNLSDNYGEIGIGNFSSATAIEGISLGYRASSDHHGGASIGAYSSDDFTHDSSDDYGYISVGRNSALTFTSEVTGESTTIPAFTRRIVGVKDPINNQDAATKNYVDTVASNKQGTLTAGSNITINNDTISATDTTYSNFTGATSSTAGTNGLVPAPASGDQEKVLHGDGTWKDTTAKLVEMSYGESNAWAKFIAAYKAGSIVYCRASSNSNPGTGSQTRKAFMAYVNNATNPTSVEFQYVRSQSSKTDSQQCDQVFVYTLTNASGGTWSVASRNMGPKVVAGTGMSSTFTTGANATITLNAEPNYSTSEVDTKVKWVDGKTVYRKTINFGALPNASLKTVAHGISNLYRVIKYDCMAYNSTSGNNTQLPLVSTVGNNSNLDISSTDIIMNTTTDRSSFDECYITLYYTKSS